MEWCPCINNLPSFFSSMTEETSITWEKVVSSKVGFRVWLPNSSEPGEGKEEEKQARHWKRQGLLMWKRGNQAENRGQVQTCTVWKKMRFSSKTKLFLTAGRVSRSLQLPPELGAGCYIEKIRQGLMWAAVTVCNGVGLLWALQVLEYQIWHGRSPWGAHALPGSLSATLPLCHCPKEQSCLQGSAAAVLPLPRLDGWGRGRAFTCLKTDLAKTPTKPKPEIWCSARAVSSSACVNTNKELIFNWHMMIPNL